MAAGERRPLGSMGFTGRRGTVPVELVDTPAGWRLDIIGYGNYRIDSLLGVTMRFGHFSITQGDSPTPLEANREDAMRIFVAAVAELARH